MSIKMMSLVWDQDLPSHLKLVLLALADHSDDDGECYPGIKHLGKKCGLNKSTISRHVNKLKDLGLLEITVSYRKNGSRKSNIFKVAPRCTSATPVAPVRILEPINNTIHSSVLNKKNSNKYLVEKCTRATKNISLDKNTPDSSDSFSKDAIDIGTTFYTFSRKEFKGIGITKVQQIKIAEKLINKYGLDEIKLAVKRVIKHEVYFWNNIRSLNKFEKKSKGFERFWIFELLDDKYISSKKATDADRVDSLRMEAARKKFREA